jgi:hypothetical protein
MGSLIRLILDKTVVRLLRYLRSRVWPAEETQDDIYKLAHRRAVQTSVEFVEKHLDQAMIFPRRERLWDYILARGLPAGLCAEFGVHEGWSINYMARRLAGQGRTIFGFDSFEGLKEDWTGTDFTVGTFDRKGELPEVGPNVTLIKGWFDKTLPGFLAANLGMFAFIHFDADTYTATTTVLQLIAERVGSGTILLFDEFLGFPNWANNEFRAWNEFATAQGLRFRYLGFGPTQAAIEVL